MIRSIPFITRALRHERVSYPSRESFGRIDVDLADGVAFGACRLPNDAGLIYKILGRETAQVKAKLREFWGVVRREVTGADLPPPFLWR